MSGQNKNSLWKIDVGRFILEWLIIQIASNQAMEREMSQLPLSPWNWYNTEDAFRDESLSSAPARAMAQFNQSVEQMMDQFFNTSPLLGLGSAS